MLIITSAANRGGGGDVSLESCHRDCGLDVPCVIRTAKIATIEAASARKGGALPADILAEVREAMIGDFGR